METVAILLSLYKPHEEFLVKQLRSLNKQDYPHAELLVWNDDPQEPVPKDLFDAYINRFPVRYYQNGKNNGFCRAFEQLAKIAQTDYIAFCDQDDIWMPGKISELVAAIKQEKALAAVCDSAIIDETDRVLCKSVRHSSRQHADTWCTAEDITVASAFCGYAKGMCLVADTESVQRCLPFCYKTGHDRWLMLCLSSMGRIVYLDRVLVQYRRHGHNTTGALAGVHTKQEYYDKRVFGESEAVVRAFEALFPRDAHLETIKKVQQARKSRNPLRIALCRKYLPDLWLYEAGLAACPSGLASALMNFLRA